MNNTERINKAIATLFELRDEISEAQAQDIIELERLLG